MRNNGISVVALYGILSAATAFGAEWRVPGDFATIQAAIDSTNVVAGDKILVGPGEHAGATVNKAVEIKGGEGATIVSGPLFFTRSGVEYRYGFLLASGSDGATISHLRLTTAFPVFARGPDDVTVTQCTMINAIQGVSNWGGSRWEISHNEALDLRTLSGGGIAILVADRLGGCVQDNVISHNRISGTLHVDPQDCGGYSGTGVVLYADYRWGNQGTYDMSWNRIVKNKISLEIDDPREPGVGDPLGVVAVELTDTRDINDGSIHHNAIGFNDLRGTVDQIALTPETLEQAPSDNTVSRNLGENRGHGAHPSAFGPGGS